MNVHRLNGGVLFLQGSGIVVPRAGLWVREKPESRSRRCPSYSLSRAQGMAGAGGSALGCSLPRLLELQGAGQWGPTPGLVSGPGASVVNRGWTDAGLPPGSLVDRRQLAPSTALTMYPSLATDPWPQTIPTAYSVSGMISPPLEAPVKKAGMRAAFGTFILGTGRKVRHLLSD